MAQGTKKTSGSSTKKEVALRDSQGSVLAEKALDGTALKQFAKYVDIHSDFSLFKQGGGMGIEPKRELAMKLITFFDFSVDTELVRVDNIEKKNSKGKITERMYTMKATVTAPSGAFATGHGMASTEQSHTEGREDHDAMARAETRAIKRAIEGRVGLPIINQLILHFFGGYSVGPKKMQELGLR